MSLVSEKPLAPLQWDHGSPSADDIHWASSLSSTNFSRATDHAIRTRTPSDVECDRFPDWGNSQYWLDIYIHICELKVMAHRCECLCSASQLWLPHPALCIVLPECFQGLHVWSRAVGSKSGKLWIIADHDTVWGYTRDGNSQPEREDNEWLITMSMHELPWMSYSPKSQWHLYMWKIVRALMYVEVWQFEAALVIRLCCKHFMTVSRLCLASPHLSSFGEVEVPWVVYGSLMVWGCAHHHTSLQTQVRHQVFDSQQVMLGIIMPICNDWAPRAQKESMRTIYSFQNGTCDQT